jgi:hypothetical protein
MGLCGQGLRSVIRAETLGVSHAPFDPLGNDDLVAMVPDTLQNGRDPRLSFFVLVLRIRTHTETERPLRHGLHRMPECASFT